MINIKAVTYPVGGKANGQFGYRLQDRLKGRRVGEGIEIVEGRKFMLLQCSTLKP